MYVLIIQYVKQLNLIIAWPRFLKNDKEKYLVYSVLLRVELKAK